MPGLLSPPFCAAIMPDNDDAMDRLWKFGLREDEASAFIIVCFGMDSTDNALLRWVWNDLGA